MGAFLLSAFGIGKSIAGAVGAFLAKLNPWQLACLAFALWMLVVQLEWADARHDRDAWKKQFTAEHAARQSDADAYARAQADAATMNKAQVGRIEQQYQRNSDDEENAYQRDLARLRGDYDRLRAQPQAAAGAAGAPASPAPVGPSAGADGDGLPVPPGDNVQTREAAGEIELRLMHLQQWVKKQLAVDPNAP